MGSFRFFKPVVGQALRRLKTRTVHQKECYVAVLSVAMDDIDYADYVD